MFEITTDKQKSKTVKVDGFTYKVRQPGAGNSLALQEAGRKIVKLGQKSTLTKDEETELETLIVKAVSTCLNLFDALGDAKAQEYIDSLDIETLLAVVGQVFSEENNASAEIS